MWNLPEDRHRCKDDNMLLGYGVSTKYTAIQPPHRKQGEDQGFFKRSLDKLTVVQGSSFFPDHIPDPWARQAMQSGDGLPISLLFLLICGEVVLWAA